MLVLSDNDKIRCTIAKHGGDHYLKHFKCRNLLLAILFVQLTKPKSLRDLIDNIDKHHCKYHTLGLYIIISMGKLTIAYPELRL